MRAPIGFLAPYAIALAILWAAPLAEGLWLSLHADRPSGTGEFVGAAHYAALLGDGRFLGALANTARHAALSVALVLPLAVALAHLLREAPAVLRGPLRFALVLPGVTPPFVLALLFVLVFGGRHGVLNAWVLAPLGLPAADWLKDPPMIRLGLLLQTAWRWTGFVCLFVSAALEAIPRAQYETARAEGAGAPRLLVDVTLPHLRPALAFAATLLALDAFALFAGAYALLGGSGGAGDASLLLVAYTHQTAFTYGRFGAAAAMAFATAVPLLALVALVAWTAGRARSRPA